MQADRHNTQKPRQREDALVSALRRGDADAALRELFKTAAIDAAILGLGREVRA